MNDVLNSLSALRRPRILIRAARIGAAEYRRDTHLRRHLGYGTLPRSADALHKLVEIEVTMNAQRRAKSAAYSPAQHVDVLIAMMGEAHILRTAHLEVVT